MLHDEACAAGVTTSISTRVVGSIIYLQKPQSIPMMVTDDSAMFITPTTLRHPAGSGSNASICCVGITARWVGFPAGKDADFLLTNGEEENITFGLVENRSFYGGYHNLTFGFHRVEDVIGEARCIVEMKLRVRNVLGEKMNRG